MKEKESKQKEEEAKSSQNGKCSECKEELIPPLKVYICQEGHLHREGQGKHRNKNVKKGNIKSNFMKIFSSFVLPVVGPLSADWCS